MELRPRSRTNLRLHAINIQDTRLVLREDTIFPTRLETSQTDIRTPVGHSRGSRPTGSCTSTYTNRPTTGLTFPSTRCSEGPRSSDWTRRSVPPLSFFCPGCHGRVRCLSPRPAEGSATYILHTRVKVVRGPQDENTYLHTTDLD